MAKKKKISYEKAKEHFKKLPKKTQQRDMSRKSKKPYEKYNIPASYIKKGGHRKGDVKNLDTPQYTYGRRGTRLKSVYQLRRILKRKARDYKHPTTRNKRLKEYEKETKPMLDKLKDSDINGLFISYGDKKADGYGEKTTRVRKIKGFRGEEFRGLGFKFKKVKGKKYPVKTNEPKIYTNKVQAVEGVEREKKRKGLYIGSSKASHRDDPMYADY